VRQRQAAEGAAVEEPVAITDPVHWSLRAARYRWAELLRRIYEVDPLACPRCSAPMRIAAVITDPAVITRIGVHRARSVERARPSRSPPPGPVPAGPPRRRQATSVARSFSCLFPFVPAPNSGSGASRRERCSPPRARCSLQRPAATRAGPEQPRSTRIPPRPTHLLRH